jgi:hypothetical protein
LAQSRGSAVLDTDRTVKDTLEVGPETFGIQLLKSSKRWHYNLGRTGQELRTILFKSAERFILHIGRSHQKYWRKLPRRVLPLIAMHSGKTHIRASISRAV